MQEQDVQSRAAIARSLEKEADGILAHVRSRPRELMRSGGSSLRTWFATRKYNDRFDTLDLGLVLLELEHVESLLQQAYDMYPKLDDKARVNDKILVARSLQRGIKEKQDKHAKVVRRVKRDGPIGWAMLRGWKPAKPPQRLIRL